HRGMTEKGSPVSGQELQRLLTRRKAPEFAIVRFMLRRFRGPQHDEFPAFLFDQRGEFLAVVRRHMPRAAMRTVIVAHAGPLIGPYPLAAAASVEIQKPGHATPPTIANDILRTEFTLPYSFELLASL